METNELLNERQKTHGDFDHFSEICQALKTICKERYEHRSNRQNEAIDMICNKLARVITGDPNFADHWDDIKGYAQLGKQGHKTEITEKEYNWLLNSTNSPEGITKAEKDCTLKKAAEVIHEIKGSGRDLKSFRVTYYYLATGMDGRAEKKDYGVVEAASAEAAKKIIAARESATKQNYDWLLSCLTAKEVTVEDSNI